MGAWEQKQKVAQRDTLFENQARSLILRFFFIYMYIFGAKIQIVQNIVKIILEEKIQWDHFS